MVVKVKGDNVSENSSGFINPGYPLSWHWSRLSHKMGDFVECLPGDAQCSGRIRRAECFSLVFEVSI